MQVKGHAKSSLADALEEAITSAPRTGNAPRTYEVIRAWVEDGGVVGRMYYVEVRVTGQDVEP